MNTNYLLLSACVFLLACSQEAKKEEASVTKDSIPFKYHETIHNPSHRMDSTNNPFKGKLVAEAVNNDSLGWGYVISVDGKKAIVQPHVPGVAGRKGFKTKEQALTTANFVIYKIEHNILPPSISQKELDSLGVLK